MAYDILKCKISSVAPLLMHNIQLADPRNQFTRAMKQITAKGKKKTDADLEELSRLEFLGGMYVDASGHPVIPGENIEGCIRDGAKKARRGKDVTIGLFCDGVWPLLYDGPKTAEKLWELEAFRDYRGVRVNAARLMRTRCKFMEWQLEFAVNFDPEVLNREDVEKALEQAGNFVGLMDGRPRFGRFVVDSVK